MKYNLNEIMQNAHLFRRQFNCTMSLALRMAWNSEKKKAIIDRYASKTFISRMSDNYSANVYTTYQQDDEYMSPWRGTPLAV